MKRVIYGLIAVGLLAGCSSMSVQTDFSPAADFSSFETFRYAQSDRSVADAAPLSDQRIVAAIRREMAAAGLKEVESGADLVVTYYASISEQLQFHTMYTGVGGWGGRGRMGMGMSGSTTRATTFEEGTLVIDVWQAEEDQLVWRGTIMDTLRDNPERNAEMINRGIARAFESLPPN